MLFSIYFTIFCYFVAVFITIFNVSYTPECCIPMLSNVFSMYEYSQVNYYKELSTDISISHLDWTPSTDLTLSRVGRGDVLNDLFVSRLGITSPYDILKISQKGIYPLFNDFQEERQFFESTLFFSYSFNRGCSKLIQFINYMIADMFNWIQHQYFLLYIRLRSGRIYR